MGHLDDNQTVLKPLKQTEKIEINVYDHLWLAELFKMINRPGPTRQPDRNYFDGLFIGKYKRHGRKINGIDIFL